MAIQPTKPLEWKKAAPDEIRLLQNLQGNILKGHGRHFTANIFLRFGADQAQSRRVVRELANYHLVNAHRQLLDAEKFKSKHDGGGAFCHLALSFTGYAALGRGNDAPGDDEFVAGMRSQASIDALADPALTQWEAAFRDPIDAVLLCAHDSESETALLTGQMRELLEAAGCSVLHVQRGKALFNAKRDGIEHFGYVDGRSQPLLLVEDINAEAAKAGVARWDPSFGLDIALVVEPAFNDPETCGSYFVFRKLEQNVQEFKRAEQQTADTLGLTGDQRELAGALLVGRFENGTPVTMADEAQEREPMNDFDYDGDAGARCPFHAHIRKTNPRGSAGTGGGGNNDEPGERKHLMARRGIPYEDVRREVHPDELPEADTTPEFEQHVAPLLPTGGVGLLFMAYNSSIGMQFRFTQESWANNKRFPVQPSRMHGLDPVIGQGTNVEGEQNLPSAWDSSSATQVPAPFAGHVTMKGGEYFFSPSLRFLKTL